MSDCDDDPLKETSNYDDPAYAQGSAAYQAVYDNHGKNEAEDARMAWLNEVDDKPDRDWITLPSAPVYEPEPVMPVAYKQSFKGSRSGFRFRDHILDRTAWITLGVLLAFGGLLGAGLFGALPPYLRWPVLLGWATITVYFLVARLWFIVIPAFALWFGYYALIVPSPESQIPFPGTARPKHVKKQMRQKVRPHTVSSGVQP